MCDVMIATYSTGGKKEDRKAYKILSMEKGSCLLKSTNATKFTEKKNVDIRPQVSAMHIRSCFKEIFFQNLQRVVCSLIVTDSAFTYMCHNEL